MTSAPIGTFGQHATGSLTAQKIVHELRTERATTDTAYLRLIELAAEYGWKSAAVRGYFLEIAKRVR